MFCPFLDYRCKRSCILETEPYGIRKRRGKTLNKHNREEELLEVTQWVGIRAQWFNNCFLLSISLNHGFANVSPKNALRWSPEIVLSKWQAQYHISRADIPCLLQPSVLPLKSSMGCYPGFLLGRHFLSRIVTAISYAEDFIFEREAPKEEKILNWVAGEMKYSSNLEVFPSGGSR